MKFPDLLYFIDNAIKEHQTIRVPRSALTKSSNTAAFLKWLQKHRIVEIVTTEKRTAVKKKKTGGLSRQRKMEITLLLLALDVPKESIAQRFKVKKTTVQGYMKAIGRYDLDYLRILKQVLQTKGIKAQADAKVFPDFPIRISSDLLKKTLTTSEFEKLSSGVEKSRLLKFVVGLNLGTQDLAILFPK